MNDFQTTVQQGMDTDDYTPPETPTIPLVVDATNLLNNLVGEVEVIKNHVYAEDMLEVGTSLAKILIATFKMTVAYGIDIEPVFYEVYEDLNPNVGAIINSQYSEGYENITVYNTPKVPLTFEVGGPKIGEANVVMDTFGNMLIEGVVSDTDFLPQIQAISIEDLSIYIGDGVTDVNPVTDVEDDDAFEGA